MTVLTDNGNAPPATAEGDAQAEFDREFAARSAAADRSESESEQEQEPAPAGDDVAEPGADAPASEGPTPANDPWADAPEALRLAHQQEVERLTQANKSANGRVSVLNNKARTLEQDLERERAAKSATGTKPKLADILGTDEFKNAKETFGDDLKPLFDAIEAAASETGSLAERNAAIEQEREAAADAAANAALEEAVPNWLPRMQAHGETAFRPWLEAQPRHVQEAFARNEKQVADPAEAADVISRFLASVEKPGQPKPNAQHDARRTGQLDAAANVNTKGPGATTTATDDYEAEFSKRSALRAQGKL